MNNGFTSKERMLLMLENQTADYIPCSFMLFSALRDKCNTYEEFIEQQLLMGLDVKVELPKLPLRFHPEVKIKEYLEKREGNSPLIHTEYHTPKGTLTREVIKTIDWPYGDHIPFLVDYIISRSKKFLITKEEDLEALKFLFFEPTAEDISQFRKESKRLKKIADKNGLLVSGGWSLGDPPHSDYAENTQYGCMGLDSIHWLCGSEGTILLAMDKPEMLEELLRIIFKWNIKRMEIILDEGVDIIIRRAWYEGTDLWSPRLYRQFVVPGLKKEIQLTHQSDSKFGYIMTSGIMPLLEEFLDLKIDANIGVDPVQGIGTEMRTIKKTLGGKVCLWGGVSASITLEQGTKKDVEEAVYKAVEILSPEGGFILSPVDNIRDDSKQTYNNINTFLQTWKKIRCFK
jgi:hypothetical protein